MRLFIALPLEEYVRQQIKKIQTEFISGSPRADVNWVKPDNLHLTLKFLGETEENLVPKIIEFIAPIVNNFSTFTLCFNNLGVFPNLSRPRVIWIGATEGENQLKQTARSIDQQLTALSFPEEERPFTAHLTLGRVRSSKGKEQIVNLINTVKIATPIFQIVKEIHLVQSVLHSTGPLYTTIHCWYLKKM